MEQQQQQQLLLQQQQMHEYQQQQQQLEMRNKMWQDRFNQVVTESAKRERRLSGEVGVLSSKVADLLMSRTMCKMELADKIKAYLVSHQFHGYTSVPAMLENIEHNLQEPNVKYTRKRNIDDERKPLPIPVEPRQSKFGIGGKRCHSVEPMEEDAAEPFGSPGKRRAFVVTAPC
eukprot:TRINITY_DN2724_c4_g1_i1.p1 TRINITY_DN2724_c4_g1~~TRINITY_DN2724_c4_g1_i1.p1  ORF type:complete len:174 (+),score=26.56 TRINITY_DN2724_c4_g1_i1:54-575(+)